MGTKLILPNKRHSVPSFLAFKFPLNVSKVTSLLGLPEVNQNALK